MTVAGGDQVRQERFGAVDHAPIVHVHDSFNVLELSDLDVAAVGDAGVVVDLVDLAEVGLHVIGIEQERLPFRHVEAVRFDRRSDGLEPALGNRQSLGVDVTNRHRRPVPPELHG